MKLSKKAKEFIEESFYLGVDEEYVIEKAREALQRPSDAGFWDDELYETHTLVFHTPAWHLTDEYILDQANYRSALEQLEEYGAQAATVGHWTYSTYECIKMRVLNKKGRITKGFVALCELLAQMEDYPMLDEGIYYELEEEVTTRALENALDWEEREREITFTDEQKEHIIQLYMERWSGYFETGYIGDNEFSEVVDDVLNGQYQEHQEAKLW